MVAIGTLARDAVNNLVCPIITFEMQLPGDAAFKDRWLWFQPQHLTVNGCVVGCEFVALAVVQWRFGQGEDGARGVPPHLSSRLRGSEEIAATLASDAVAGGGVGVCLSVGQVLVGQTKVVAERACVWIQSVGTGCLRGFGRIHQLRRSRVCHGAAPPLAVLVRLGVERRELLHRSKTIRVLTVRVVLGFTDLAQQRVLFITCG